MPIFDVCVIGAGLIGSAAAKYCAQGGARTCLIGPPEPIRENYASHDVFGAWYDEGRITRHLDSDPVWTHLAAESIKRYGTIEAQSGVNFYTENGYLMLVDARGEPSLDETVETAKQLGVRYQLLQNDELKRKFPYLRAPDGMVGLYEANGAGTINPRRLVEAQLKLLQKHGGVFIPDLAVKVERLGDEAATYRIHTSRDQTIDTKRILVCAGAFFNHFPILPSPNLDITYRTAIVSRIRVEQGAVLDELVKSMPSFKFTSKRGRREHIFGQGHRAASTVTYEEREGGGLAFGVLAPIRYPDGHYYLKVEYLSGTAQRCLYDREGVSEWFRSGPSRNQAVGRQLAELAGNFVKGLNTGVFEVDTCVRLETPTRRPYIGQLDAKFYIVTGDNGYAAKSSDELGRLGALLTINDGKWPSDFLTEDMLRIRFIKTDGSKL